MVHGEFSWLDYHSQKTSDANQRIVTARHHSVELVEEDNAGRARSSSRKDLSNGPLTFSDVLHAMVSKATSRDGRNEC